MNQHKLLICILTGVLAFGGSAGLVEVARADHGNGCNGSATNIGSNSSTGGTISPSGENDYFRVDISGSGTLTASSSSGIDTYGYILNSGCSVLSQDDDSAGSLQFRTSTAVASGTYYIRVRHYSSGTGGYTLNLSFAASGGGGAPPPPSGGGADDHGNTCSTATGAAPTDSISGAINPAGDSDYFRIGLVSAGTLTVGTSGSTDTYGDLKDSGCNTLQSNDDTNGLNFQIVRSVSAGTYYVAVRHYSSSGTGSYTFNSSFAASPPPPPPDDFGGTCSAAQSVNPTSSTAGSINFNGDEDFFRIDISGPGTLTLGTSGSTDTYGYLKDSNCNDITYDDDSGPGTNFEIVRSVSAATYYVKVRHYAWGATGNYTFNSSYASQPPSAPATPTGLSATPSPAVKGQNITFNWNSVSGATYYGVGFYMNGTWDSNWVVANTNSITYPPAGYASTSGLSSLGAVVIACKNQSQNPCSSPTGQVTVAVQDPTPANTAPATINTTSGSTAGYSGSLSSSTDVQYVRIPTSSSDAVYRVQTSGSITPTIAIVDANGNAISPSAATDIQISGNTATFKVPANATYYIKFTGATGSYNYGFQRYRNFPYFQGQ